MNTKLKILTDKHLFRGLLTNGIENDFDIISLAKNTKQLNFNKNYLNPNYKPTYHETPFDEIRFVNTFNIIPENFSFLFYPPQISPLGIAAFSKKLVETTIHYLEQVIDPDEKYLIFHSAGFDSRIISLCLTDIRMRLGEDFTKNIHFRCHQPENEMFLEIMKRQGWHPDQYSVYEGPELDYYDIGRKDIPLNGWQNYNQQMNFWHDIIPEDREHEYNLMVGLGGEVFKYLAKYPVKTPTISQSWPLHLLLDHNPGHGEWEGLWLRRFKSLLMPFFSYEYLAVSTTINPAFCQFDGESDNIRRTCVKYFIEKLGIDCYNIPYGKHDYSWKISNKRKVKMYEAWVNSKFAQHEAPDVKLSDFSKNMYGFEARMWGFMTVYDAIF